MATTMHSSIRLINLAVAALLLLLGCKDSRTPAKQGVVARVGDRLITSKEFQRSYEFGPSGSKRAPDRKRSYLQAMIDELVLSLEGYRVGLHKTERVRNLESRLLEDLLAEELLRHRVEAAVTASEEEVRDAFMKSQVGWKLRYWVESDSAVAQDVFDMMQGRGYADVVAQRLATRDGSVGPRDLETAYLGWLETPPVLLDAIKDLEVGDFSRPVPLDNAYVLIQLVDIRRSATSEHDYAEAFGRFRDILYQRKLNEATSKYVAGFMTAQDVVVRGQAFSLLVDAVSAWRMRSDPTKPFHDAVETGTAQEPELQALRSRLDDTGVTFAGGRWTVRDLLGRLDTPMLRRTPMEHRSAQAYLKREIGVAVRQALLSREARSAGLQESPVIQDQLRAWRDKWVYQEMRNLYVRQAGLESPTEGSQDSMSFQVRSRPVEEFLVPTVDALRTKYGVEIFHAVLDTIPVTDFEKSRWADVYLFKGSTKRPALPTVDPPTEYGAP